MQGDATCVAALLSAVNPAADDNAALTAAARAGHVAVVELLLADARVDPTARGSLALSFAIASKRAAAAVCLLRDPRVASTRPQWKPEVPINREAFETGAVEVGDPHLLQLLLSLPWADPAKFDNEAIRRAAAIPDQPEIVELLLADPRVDASIFKRVEYIEDDDPFSYWQESELGPFKSVAYESDIRAAVRAARVLCPRLMQELMARVHMRLPPPAGVDARADSTGSCCIWPPRRQARAFKAHAHCKANNGTG